MPDRDDPGYIAESVRSNDDLAVWKIRGAGGRALPAPGIAGLPCADDARVNATVAPAEAEMKKAWPRMLAFLRQHLQ